MEFAFSTDDNYAVHLATVITSIFESHEKDLKANFHILDNGISDAHREALTALFRGRESTILFHSVPQMLTLGKDTPSYISPATLSRLLLPTILPDTARILYLDIDIVVLGNLGELWKTQLEDNWAAMSESYWTKYKTYKTRIGLKDSDPYFNAGIALFDLDALRQNGMAEKFLEYLNSEKDNIEFADQDVLNHCLLGKIKALHPRWNVPTGIQNWNPGDTITIDRTQHNEAASTPIIAHFTGKRKPWGRECDHPSAAKFRRIALRTPWPDKVGTATGTNYPLVSVIMSIHNDEQYLRDAISSIIDQTYSNIEFIIVNDASTDRAPEILAHFASEDPRVIVLNNDKQLGLAMSLNIALAEAKGDYIARMDGDDISHPDRIHQQVDFMEANPEVTVLGTRVTVIRPTWWESKEYSFPIYEKDRDIKVNFLKRPGIVHPTVMLRASFLREHEIQYNPAFLRSQDYELWVRLALVHKAVFHNLQVPLLSYRVKGGDRTPNVAMQDHYKMLVHAEILNMLGSGTSKRLEYHALWAAGKLPKFNGVKIKDKNLMEHLKFLVEANNKKGIFDKVTLRRTLFDDVKKELFYAYRAGKTAWDLYRKSSVKKHLGIDKKNERRFKRRCMMWEAWHIARTIPIVGFILFMAVAVARPTVLYQTASLKKAKL